MFSRANLDAAFRQAFGVGVGVAQYEHKSAVLGCNMVVSVIDPSCHLKKNCPVVYWLSGLTCTDRNFVEKAGAVEAAVMIDAELSFGAPKRRLAEQSHPQAEPILPHLLSCF